MVLLRSFVNPFKFSLVNFATTGATSSQMFPLLWEGINICELNSLKLLAATCGGASPNRNLFCMHFPMTKEDDINLDTDVTYRTGNLFSSETRFIYFISNVPLLMKTTQNCLYNCAKGKYTGYLWKNGMSIIWNDIYDIFYEDRECGLHILPKQSNDLLLKNECQTCSSGSQFNYKSSSLSIWSTRSCRNSTLLFINGLFF